MVPDSRDDAVAFLRSSRGLLVVSFVVLLVISGGLTGAALDARIAAANVDRVSVTPTAYTVTSTADDPRLAVTFEIRNPTGHSITLTSVQARARADGGTIVSTMAAERVTVPAGETATETIEFGLVGGNDTIGDSTRRAKTGLRETAITFRGTAKIRIVDEAKRIAIDTATIRR